MTSFLNLFLKSELTCIPRMLNKYIGNYYDNALCNGATWMFLLWNILHYLFDKFLDVFLRRVGYKQHTRDVLLTSLWYLGFYSSALAYTASTLQKNDVELFNFKRMHVPVQTTNLPTEIMGYILICTFYLHSAFWELVRRRDWVKMIAYFALNIFFVSSFILRIIEISFTLTALVSALKVVEEFSKIFFILSDKRESLLSKISSTGIVSFLIIVLLGVNAFVIPVTFLLPMAIKIISDYPNTLFISMMWWLAVYLTAEIYKSVLWKMAMHWIYHMEKDKPNSCQLDIFDCCMFEKRDDFAFHMQRFREESKRRDSELMSLRKPKNRNMLFLKCLVSIKKKFDQKKRNRADNSDSDSEKSDDDYNCSMDDKENVEIADEPEIPDDKSDCEINFRKEAIGDCLNEEKEDSEQDQDDLDEKEQSEEEIYDKSKKD